MKKIIFNSLRKNKINIDEDLFYYGWSVSVNYLLYVIMTLAVSLYFHCFYNTIVFLVLYIPIRRYIGGFHFSNNTLCIFVSTIVSVIPAILSKYYVINTLVSILFNIILIAETVLIAPIDHPNKRLNDIQFKLYKKKALVTEISYLGIVILSEFFAFSTVPNLIFYVDIISICSLSISYIKRSL